ncbi:Serine/threonine-protein kinase RsbT [Candidatus Methylobacter favarea]|uniref:Serine/threonine-protein kinase RsbT n=1 Tax=Candidatus Methylobacter favarea TaxID=2707345 RepID=A0A8S0X362_9GAMM|nr:anti-sigma regulatory factor [Candidatus Methylobacter favarea]CAA9892474.1 Serine/threonine-protein kinase RsbT [Candidatus Methylobacter favarea]
MSVSQSETAQIQDSEDIVRLRQRVRDVMKNEGFSLVDQTKMVTAASELARNTLIYGGGGTVILDILKSQVGRVGLRLFFEDHGPGIADIDQALKDGFTTGVGLGLGLGGSKRLVNEFVIDSGPDAGTRITITRWR